MSDGHGIVRPGAVQNGRLQTRETTARKLTEPLGCTGLRVKPGRRSGRGDHATRPRRTGGGVRGDDSGAYVVEE
jgi:hypothetical protein